MDFLLSRRMHKAQLGGVKGQAWRTVFIGNHTSIASAIVDRLSTYRMARLRQVNTNLVRAAGFKLTDQNRVFRELLEHGYMRHGMPVSYTHLTLPTNREV